MSGHPSLSKSAATAVSHAALQALLAEGAVVVVAKQQAGRGIARHVDVGPSVVIEIRGHSGQPVAAFRRGDAGTFRYVLESTIAVVVIQQMRLRRQAARSTVHRNALPVATGDLPRRLPRLEVELQVVGDEQVQVAIAVVIHEGAAGSPSYSRREQTRLFGDIGERAVSIIAVENVLAPGSGKDVVNAIVIIVCDGDAVRPTRARESGLRGDIGEGAIPVVLVQPVGGPRRRAFQARAAEHEDIQPAVVIVIEEGDAAAHRFDDVQVAVDAAVNHRFAQARVRGHVRKARVKGQPGRLAARHGLHAAACHLAECDGGDKGEEFAACHKRTVPGAVRVRGPGVGFLVLSTVNGISGSWGTYTTVLPRASRFVFRRDLVPGLPAMECEHPPRSSLVPTLWRLISAHCLLLPLAACTSVRGLAIVGVPLDLSPDLSKMSPNLIRMHSTIVNARQSGSLGQYRIRRANTIHSNAAVHSASVAVFIADRARQS